ncbi:NAD(P)/FAD-dependent oxidoreductase [Brevibacillus sp. TJ4]|uniref:NAD(P)/FAD-dependent oxidoreductase n=1 Tax=Brevibacillus sp. TJ4 TaxID=3234853 RepID=UPI0037CFF4EB
MLTADAVVIGGGVIGTSIAYRLAVQGRTVMLVDKGGIGEQTSGSCDKGVFLQSKKPGIHLELAKASREVFEHLEEELGMSISFRRSGGMIVIETEEQRERLESFVQQQQEAGVPVQLLEKEEAFRHQPALSRHIVGATRCDLDAEVNPLHLSHAFATAAVRSGARLMTHTEVTGIGCSHGQVREVVTTRGTISTEVVVNAAGPFAAAVAAMAGLRIPVKPRRGMILISEKTAPLIRGSMLCARYILAKHQTPATNGGQEPNLHGIGLSLGQTESGNLLIGGSREFKGFDAAYDPALASAIARHAVRIVPALAGLRIIRTMIGFRPYTGDGLPIVDEMPEVKGLIVAAGHEGDGIALAPISGLLVADLLEGRRRYAHVLKHLALSRFAHDVAAE